MEPRAVRRFSFLIGCVLAGAHGLSAQTSSDTLEGHSEDLFERALENITEDVDDSQAADVLFQVRQNPVNLNTATMSELQQIPGITPILAFNIVSYREHNSFKSVDDVEVVAGMNQDIFQSIRDFLTVGNSLDPQYSASLFSVQLRSRTIKDLQERRGYQDGSFRGSPYKTYNKLTVKYAVESTLILQVGGLTEKDAGEKDLADFASGYIEMATSTGSFRVLAGDYVVEAGQGLVYWRSSGISKGSEVISSVSRNPGGLEPYASSDENNFFRGCAIEAVLGSVKLTTLYSRKAINGNLSDQGLITSLNSFGLFRTQSELNQKSVSTEQLWGANAKVHINENFNMGLRAYATRFGHPVALSRVSGFHGQTASITGLDGSYTTNTWSWFFEGAVDHEKSFASIGGLILEPRAGLDVALVIRNYPRSFVSLHGSAFGESGGRVENERGIYSSVRSELLDWLTISLYYDQFSSEGSNETSLLPTHGHETFAMMDIHPDERMSLQFQVRQKKRSDAQMIEDEYARPVNALGERSQVNYRVTLEWYSSSVLRWRSRFETNRVAYSIAGTPAQGIVFYQDIRCRPFSRFSVDGRAVVFETDSYDSRIYEYESELRGTFVNPALFGKGIRLYVLGRYSWTGFELSAKYACTIKPGMRALSSGPSEIQGDTDNQLSLQVDISL